MSKPFTKLKSSTLSLSDILPKGKLQGCRVQDVIEDHHEYLIWASKAGLFIFSAEVNDKIADAAGYAAREQYYREEVAPYVDDGFPIIGTYDKFNDGPKTVYNEDGSGYLESCGPAGRLYFDRNGNT